jgi:hypothetical protein
MNQGLNPQRPFSADLATLIHIRSTHNIKPKDHRSYIFSIASFVIGVNISFMTLTAFIIQPEFHPPKKSPPFTLIWRKIIEIFSLL